MAVRSGDDWILNGQKTFITNGINADLVLVAATANRDKGAQGITLFGVERGMPGFARGRNLGNIGLKAQDTAELFFSEVRVPAANVVGNLDGGFVHLTENLPQERRRCRARRARDGDRDRGERSSTRRSLSSTRTG